MSLFARCLLLCTSLLVNGSSCGAIASAMDSGTEITLWLESGVAVASSQLSVRRELPLGAQEVVISSDTSGINGIVVTSRRHLRFSNRALTWSRRELDVTEKMTGFHSNDYGAIFITNQRVIGFPPFLGSFASKPLDVHERIANVDERNLGEGLGQLLLSDPVGHPMRDGLRCRRAWPVSVQTFVALLLGYEADPERSGQRVQSVRGRTYVRRSV